MDAITIKFPEGDKSKLKHDAYQHDMNVSEYIRWLISSERNKSCGEEPHKKAHWILQSDDSFCDYYICSECGREIETGKFTPPEEKYPYCHCGAKMIAEE